MGTPLHGSLKFGDLDEVLKEPDAERTSRPVSVCIFRTTLLSSKDRVACQVFDGGSAYSMPHEGVAYGMRLVMRAQAVSLAELHEGHVVKLAAETVIHKLRSGERVLDCYSAEIVDDWPQFKSFCSQVVNNPLALPNPPTTVIYHPPQETYKPERPTRGAASGGGAAGGVLTAAASSSSSVRAEPYKAVRQRDGGAAGYLKISDLTQYVDRWRVLARVTAKSAVREYSNARGPGRLFNVDLIDESGCETRATFFNEAVNAWYDKLLKGSVYAFANGQIKPVNPRFKHFDHPYELTFGADASITPVEQLSQETTTAATASIPITAFAHRQLTDVNTANVGDFLDIVGIIQRAYPLGQITIRATGTQKNKRTIVLYDQSLTSCDLTLWGDDCTLVPDHLLASNDDPFGEKPLVIISCKKAKIDDFNGRRLGSSTGNATVNVWDAGDWHQINAQGDCVRLQEQDKNQRPEFEAVSQLKDWFESEGKHQTDQIQRVGGGAAGAGGAGAGGANQKVTPIAEMLKVATATDPQQLQTQGLYFTVAASIVETMHRRFHWPSCRTCGKKITQPTEGGNNNDQSSRDFLGLSKENAEPFHCASCDKDVDEADIERKYNFSLDLQDQTGSVRVSVLGDAGLAVMGGVAANTIEHLRQNGEVDQDGREFEDHWTQLRRLEALWRIQVKSDTWQDSTRIKYRLMGSQYLVAETQKQYLRAQKSSIERLLQGG